MDMQKPISARESIDNLVEGHPAYRKILFCPSCGTKLRIESWTTQRCFGAGTILKDNRNPKYCPDCGVKIDWTACIEAEVDE